MLFKPHFGRKRGKKSMIRWSGTPFFLILHSFNVRVSFSDRFWRNIFERDYN